MISSELSRYLYHETKVDMQTSAECLKMKLYKNLRFHNFGNLDNNRKLVYESERKVRLSKISTTIQ